LNILTPSEVDTKKMMEQFGWKIVAFRKFLLSIKNSRFMNHWLTKQFFYLFNVTWKFFFVGIAFICLSWLFFWQFMIKSSILGYCIFVCYFCSSDVLYFEASYCSIKIRRSDMCNNLKPVEQTSKTVLQSSWQKRRWLLFSCHGI